MTLDPDVGRPLVALLRASLKGEDVGRAGVVGLPLDGAAGRVSLWIKV